MKKCVYLENLEEMNKIEGDVGVQCDKYDAAHGLSYDGLARAMYASMTCGKNSGGMISLDQKNMILDAVEAGEIGSEYITWKQK